MWLIMPRRTTLGGREWVMGRDRSSEGGDGGWPSRGGLLGELVVLPRDPGLHLVQLLVHPVRGEQVVMCPPLDDLPLVHHQDQVGPADGREAVGDHERGPP